jgi:hypothetical protein
MLATTTSVGYRGIPHGNFSPNGRRSFGIPLVWAATAIKIRTTPKLIQNRFSQNTMKFAVEFLFHWVYTYFLTINLAKNIVNK